MFETATWRLHNRRGFAVVEALYTAVGRELNTEGWNVEDDAEVAAGLAYRVGVTLLGGSIAGGATHGTKVSRRSERAAWKEVTTDGGARAAVFLTLATAAMLSREFEPDIDQVPVDHARHLVEDAFTPPPEDLAVIEEIRERVVEQRRDPPTVEATERGGTLATELVNVGQATLSFRALELAGVNPRAMPAFEEVAEVDQSRWSEVVSFNWLLAASIHFRSHWDAGKERLLELAFSVVYG